MGKQRIATILAPKDLGPSGTEVIDINLSDIISRISFIWKAKVATVSDMLAPALRAISKVELVDGSDVLFSLSGEEAQGLNFINRKVMPYNLLSVLATEFQIAEFSIDFGRFLYDPIYAFDPKKFRNPQLRITWNEAAANASVIVNSFQCYAHIFENGSVIPSGFLQSKEFYSYVMAASAHEYIDLPVDLPLRLLVLQGDSVARDAIGLYDILKITQDNGRRIPLDIKADDYFRIVQSMYPRVSESVGGDDAVTAKTLYVPVNKDIVVVVQYDGTAFVTGQSLFAVPTITGGKIALAASVDIKAADILVSGYLPHMCLPILFGKQDEASDWLDPADIGSLRADILATSDAGSSDTTRLITQQLRRY